MRVAYPAEPLRFFLRRIWRAQDNLLVLLEIEDAALSMEKVGRVATISLTVPRSACPLEDEAKANSDTVEEPGARFRVTTLNQSLLLVR